MADPFDALHLPPQPVAPDPGFTASLRARLVAALTLEPPDPDTVPTISLRGGDTVSTTEPDTTATLSPYLAVRDAAAALDWYRDVLGAIETTRFVGDDGRVGHAEVSIGGARLLLADEYPEAGHHGPVHYGGTPVTLHLEAVDVDHTYARAVEGGAQSEREPADQGHGNRNATIRDPFGHRWMLSQAIDATRAEEASGREDGGATRGFTVSGRRPVEPGYLTMRTRDLTRARAFFGELFAWDVEPGSQEGGGHVANTHFPMSFMESDSDGDRDSGAGSVTVYFRVDDIEPYATRVTELGGQVLSRNQYASGGNAACVDDQGFRFDLFQPAPGY